MKKAIILLIAVCILFSASGCSTLDDIDASTMPTEKTFLLESYHLKITADDTFYEKTGGSFDLQITNDNTYISIMAYDYIDLPQNITPQDVYDMQNEDIFSRRDAVTVVDEAKTQTLPQGTVVYGVHSAEKDGVKNYYASYLIDLSEKETFAWVLITAAPSYFKNNSDYLHNIVCSLTTIE